MDKNLEKWLNGYQLGTDIVQRKYLQDGETFDQWAERVSGGNQAVKELFLQKKFIPGGRILSNRGLENEGLKTTLSNCYVLSVNDSIESIYAECCKNMARTYSYGGGVGIDISKLRPAGAIVHNSARTTTGAVSFMKTFDVVTGTIGQNGRRGALMISIDVNHPDLPEFITIKANTDNITNANISVRMNNAFMEAVKNDEDYLLHWPCEMTISKDEINNVTEYNKLYEIPTMCGPVCLKKVRARDMFMNIVKTNWDYGEPGVLYWDRISSYHLMSENKDFAYAGVNPCVSGDTLILTKEGYKRIDELVDKETNVWNGYQWSKTTPKVTGHNQDMYKVSFSDGTEVTCTGYHKWVLKDGDNRKETKQLKIGDKLVKTTFPVIYSPYKPDYNTDEKLYYTLGFYSGDGTVTSNGSPAIYLFGEKQDLLPYIEDGVVRHDANPDRIVITIQKNKEKYAKDWVPGVDESYMDRLSWLAGLIDSDGSRNSDDGSISISSVNRGFLIKVKQMLNTLGSTATVSSMHKRGLKLLPNHKGGSSEYNCKDSYRLIINASNVYMLMGLGLKTHRVVLNANPNRDASRFVKVVNIEPVGVAETVYCMNEPINHTFIANGCITGNCAEEPLPDGGACLLGSMNIAEFVHDDKFDFDEFARDVKTAVIGLNEIQVEGTKLHPLEIQRESAKKYHQIGLGLFDLAGALIKLKIKYGSEEAQAFAEKVTKTMLIAAFEQSCDLNTEGVEYEGMFDSYFYKTRVLPFLPEEYKGRYPLNSQLLTIAPTGTISTMINATAGGGEPMFARFYTRTTKSIGEKDYLVYPQAVLDYFGGNPDDVDINKLPDYYISSDQISPKERIEMQAALQVNIDASISSTINLPKEATVEDVFNIYMYAWECGLKGVTVFRAGCKRTAILNSGSKEVEGEFNTVNAPKRPKVLEADFYQVKVHGENFRIFVGLLDGKPYELFAMPCMTNERIKNHKGKIIRVKKREYRFESDYITIDNIAIALEKDYDIFNEIDKISNIVSEGHKLTKGDTEIIKDAVYNIKDWSERREYRNVALHVSGNLRTGMRIEDIIKLEDKCNDSIGSFNKAISRVLAKYVPDGESDETCPECGGKLRNDGGCIVCPNCGWSKCG